jgi:hypothetical protein
MVVLCCLLAAAWGAPQAQAAAPLDGACDVLMDQTAPKTTLSSQHQTLIGILTDILNDPYGAGACCVAHLCYDHPEDLYKLASAMRSQQRFSSQSDNPVMRICSGASEVGPRRFAS